ncbi:MAG: helix-turn-helix domain-containing protein [Planctomycetes bacterium]|nr:helix-turn-helix domain-containing protein [Planctomycetota bacterium]
MIEQNIKFQPDYAVPPGETLTEVLEERGMKQSELARLTGRPLKTINEIVKGKTAITPETAIQLERVLPLPASFWNNREKQYQETLAGINEAKRLKSQVKWLRNFPLKKMVELGWIREFKDKVQQLRELLTFLGIASPEQFSELQARLRASFRQSMEWPVNEFAVASWLRAGEIRARKIKTAQCDHQAFHEVLKKIRPLTSEPPESFQENLARLCATAGVAAVFISELPNTRVHGATRWLTPEKPLIQLSLFYKANDHLWFTFFHEAGHVLLHGKRKVFLEIDRHDSVGGEEAEADRFAANVLIPPEEMEAFLSAGRFGRQDVLNFAKKIGIAPGIIVGRLQHDKLLPYNRLNELKIKLRWT